MLRIQTQRIERVVIKCPIEEKEEADAFCRTHGYVHIESSEEKETEDGRIILVLVAHKDITHELTADDYLEMAIGEEAINEMWGDDAL